MRDGIALHHWEWNYCIASLGIKYLFEKRVVMLLIAKAEKPWQLAGWKGWVQTKQSTRPTGSSGYLDLDLRKLWWRQSLDPQRKGLEESQEKAATWPMSFFLEFDQYIGEDLFR